MSILFSISSSAYVFNLNQDDPQLVEFMTSIDPINYVGNIEKKVAFVHGTEDDVMPIEAGKELFDAATEPKKFFEIEGGGF